MIVVPLTFYNFEGVRTEKNYAFHLDMAELADLELSIPGGLEQMYRNAIASKDPAKILELLKKLMLDCVGQRSSNGKYFEKNEDIRKEFQYSGAYSAMIMKLAMNEIDPATFFTGVMPKDLLEQAKKIEQAQANLSNKTIPQDSSMSVQVRDALTKNIDTDVTLNAMVRRSLTSYTDDELRVMDKETFEDLMKNHQGDIPANVMRIFMERMSKDMKKII